MQCRTHFFAPLSDLRHGAIDCPALTWRSRQQQMFGDDFRFSTVRRQSARRPRVQSRPFSRREETVNG